MESTGKKVHVFTGQVLGHYLSDLYSSTWLIYFDRFHSDWHIVFTGARFISARNVSMFLFFSPTALNRCARAAGVSHIFRFSFSLEIQVSVKDDA